MAPKEVPTGFEPVNRGFADLSLTTWVRHHYFGKITEKEVMFNPVVFWNYVLFCTYLQK